MTYDPEGMYESFDDEMECHRIDFEEGQNVSSLFYAIIICGIENQPMPDWVWKNFYDRSVKFWGLEVKTLEEAFEITDHIPKGARFDRYRNEVLFHNPVCFRLQELFNEGWAKDDNTYSKVGEEFGIGKELVKKFKKNWEKHSPDYFKRKTE